MNILHQIIISYPWESGIALFLVALIVIPWLMGIRYIPHTSVGIIEKLWSSKGSLEEGRIIALGGEAGFQAEVLRGGMHFLYYPWQYRIREQPLVTVSEGQLGYVYARDGDPLPPVQTLGRVTDSNHFQDAAAFLKGGGQRGRQRLILQRRHVRAESLPVRSDHGGLRVLRPRP